MILPLMRLGQLAARWQRTAFLRPVVGDHGSSGKTTVNRKWLAGEFCPRARQDPEQVASYPWQSE